MNRKKFLKLPNMNEFSPSIVLDLGRLLHLVREHQGEREALKRVIANTYPSITETPQPQRYNRANNVLIGMSQCGLFNLGDNQLTILGAELAAEADEALRNANFAKHLLRNCHGIELLEAVEAIRTRNETISLDNIRNELRARGFKVTTNEGNASKIRLWLELSGVVDNDWTINRELFTRLAGIDMGALDEWNQLDRSQKALLLALKDIAVEGETGWLNLAHVKKICQGKWSSRILPEGPFRAKVISPLSNVGWIETRGTGEGRGGNIGEIRPLEKLLSIDLPLSIQSSSLAIPRDLLRRLNTPLHDIFSDLVSDDTHIKGLALELLTLRLTWHVGLWPVAFRLRGRQTKGAEVDLVAEGLHLHFSRWLFQCKNTARVDLSDLAKEVGMALLLKAQVIVMVTTGKFATSIKKYANGLAETTPLQAILIDKRGLRQFRDQPDSILDLLKRQASEILSLKRHQVLDALDNEEDG